MTIYNDSYRSTPKYKCKEFCVHCGCERKLIGVEAQDDEEVLANISGYWVYNFTNNGCRHYWRREIR